jgi:nitrite reductase (NADH) small subunit
MRGSSRRWGRSDEDFDVSVEPGAGPPQGGRGPLGGPGAVPGERGAVMSDWKAVCKLEDIPVLGARRVTRKRGADVAVFRNSEDTVFALLDRCPHKGGPLSQGIVFGESVACPLHNWTIGLTDGCARAPDEGCTPRFAVKVDAGTVHLDLDELNSIALGEVSAAS